MGSTQGLGRGMVALLALAWLHGCATHEGVLRSTVERQLDCPPAGIDVVPREDGRYDVRACGEQSVWACVGGDGQDITCRPQSAAELATAGGDSAGTGLELAALGGGGTTPAGEERVEPEEPGPPDASPPPERSEASPPEPEDRAEPEEDPEPAGAPGGTAVERSVRALLDTRRLVILECVGRDDVVVSAQYNREGRLRVSLRGALAGTPEERCVATAVRDLRIQTRGRQGTVLHPLRAQP